jgi:oligopeptide transport system ATP-binding protein
MTAATAHAETEQARKVPLATLRNIVKHFEVREGLFGKPEIVHAVDGVNLDVNVAETLGIVGESGCGKSTLARVLVGLHPPTEGTVEVEGQDIHARGDAGRQARRKLQMVFQNPSGSLNPRMTVGQSVAEPLRAVGMRYREASDRVRETLDLVGLKPEFAERLPHQLSGGQQQRACIARALIADSKIVVHDESVSALDVSLQAQVLNLLKDIQDRLGLAYVFISHDLAAVQQISTRIAVMYLGKVVEVAPAADFRGNALHPYSVALRSAVPVADPVIEQQRQRIILEGDVPSPMSPPAGCRFHTRCPLAEDICRTDEPPLEEHRPGHLAACHFAGEFDQLLRPVPGGDEAAREES